VGAAAFEFLVLLNIGFPMIPPSPRSFLFCSKLALGVKLTLDQVLGFALWHAALAAVYEPHRQACMQLLPPLPPSKQQLLAAGKAG
jgi:hypothetical protein